MNRYASCSSRVSDRRGFALVVTSLLVTLLVALTSQIVVTHSSRTMVAVREHQTLAHELAVDSALALLARRLAPPDNAPSRFIEELDNGGTAAMTFLLGDVTVCCALRDDSAKFNPLLLSAPQKRPALERALRSLGERLRLPVTAYALRPVPRLSDNQERAYQWYDQLFNGVLPGMFFRLRMDESFPVWSDAVTFQGDGKIGLRRVHPDVLEAALQDIAPGLARTLLSARSTDRGRDFLAAVLAKLPGEMREAVTARIVFDAQRYATDIETSIGNDKRRWYVVFQMKEGRAVLLHRSDIRW